MRFNELLKINGKLYSDKPTVEIITVAGFLSPHLRT